MTTLHALGYDSISEYQKRIINTLSSYTEKFINPDDGIIKQTIINSDYFLSNDIWHIDFIGQIPNFKEQRRKYQLKKEIIEFTSINKNIHLEVKYYVYCRLFKEELHISTIFNMYNYYLKYLAEFINIKYPHIQSILDLDVDKANLKWIDWLHSNNKKIYHKAHSKRNGKYYNSKTLIATLFKRFYTYLLNTLDTRDEWSKDTWHIKELEKYGIDSNKAVCLFSLKFSKIINNNIKENVKIYLKQKLLNSNNFSIGTANSYLIFITGFVSFILDIEPHWNDFKYLERKHIMAYIEWLIHYSKHNLKRKNANPANYIFRALTVVNRFLEDIQLKNFDIAPQKHVITLIYPEDKPKPKRKNANDINYIPSYVLDQLFNNITSLHKEVQPIVWIMYKTGLRISDVLTLKDNCLLKLNNEYWIETSISKVKVENHRIPIDNKLADILAVLINNSIKNSNVDNNPNEFIFIRYSGSRKGRPYVGDWVQAKLNEFARKCNITDELGKLYHFKNHSFRHTYAVKMINGGADIFTVQELLAHASPEMTIRYAKLLDETKRRVFDNAVKEGVFSFNSGSKIKEEIPEDVFKMLWTNHKLNAIDTSYGTCLQRSKGKCSFAKQPPCLTCNGGNPCKDLCIGAFEGDIKKYQIHIKSTKALIEQAKKHGRNQMAKENEELLKIYKEIADTIKIGNLIYGRADKFKIR